jgi:hypothetical protein
MTGDQFEGANALLFLEVNPSREDYWRSVILFGRNVASYKFALAKSLLELADSERNFITLEDLSVPFARHIAEHLRHTPKQATSSSSRFLEAVRQFNKGEIDQDALAQKTISLGFQNVIDAFHFVNRESIPVQFFVDERKQRGGIVVTDELLKLKDSGQYTNLPFETEGRWRLVETAWELGLNPALLLVRYDSASSLFFVRNQLRARAAVRRRSWKSRLGMPAATHAFRQSSLKSRTALPSARVNTQSSAPLPLMQPPSNSYTDLVMLTSWPSPFFVVPGSNRMVRLSRFTCETFISRSSLMRQPYVRPTSTIARNHRSEPSTNF